jgi:hypothetical protein
VLRGRRSETDRLGVYEQGGVCAIEVEERSYGVDSHVVSIGQGDGPFVLVHDILAYLLKVRHMSWNILERVVIFLRVLLLDP